jgi:hypothetical protein
MYQILSAARPVATVGRTPQSRTWRRRKSLARSGANQPAGFALILPLQTVESPEQAWPSPPETTTY